MAYDFSKMTADLQSLFSVEDEKTGGDLNAGKSVKVKKTKNEHAIRRALSELALEKELEWHFKDGVTYHCLSFGDVDSLTYFRLIVKQQHIKYALLSTWTAASEDIAEIRQWIENGYVDRVDFYVGEIFKAGYRRQYDELISLCRTFGGRVCMLRNHSKIMVIIGDRFSVLVESSANLNGNPRIENTAITVDRELALWYKEQFDGFSSFDRDFDNVQPYIVEDKERQNV